MICNPGFHRGRDAKGLVYPAEVVVHEMKGDGGLEVVYFFAEGVGQPGKAPHAHPHSEVVPLYEARGDVTRVRVAGDPLLACSGANGWTVAALSGGALTAVALV